jgi:hypothetical protein
MHREAGRMHLVANRAHGAVGVLGLQQMLDQPAGVSYRPTVGHRSAQAPAMPCRRSSLSSRQVTHGLTSGAGGRSGRVGQRRFADLQCVSTGGGKGIRFEPVEHVLNVLGTGQTRLQHQIDRHQHRLQPGLGTPPAPWPSPGRRLRA